MEDDENVHVTFKEPICLINQKIEELDPIIQKRENVLKEQKKNNEKINSRESGMERWSTNRVEESIPEPDDKLEIATELRHLSLAKNVPEIVNALEKYDVLLIESPSGSGKSLLAPSIVSHYARKSGIDGTIFPALPNGQSWKAIHTGPTGEQIVQNSDFVSNCQKDGTQFGYFTSSINQSDLISKKNAPFSANYMFCTVFYGNQAFDGHLHAVVVDDVQEFTPDLMQILLRAKMAMKKSKNERNVNKIVLLSAMLTDTTREMIQDYFDEDGISFHCLNYPERRFENLTINISDPPPFCPIKNGLVSFHDDNELFRKEINMNGIPNSDELMRRSVEVQKEWMKFVEDDFKEHGNRLCRLPGIISFYPGESEASKARSMLLGSEVWKERRKNEGNESEGKFSAVLFKVSGKDRADIPFLKNEYKDGDPMRIVNATTIFSNGITLPGIGIAIDDGTIKIPGPYNHKGILYFDLIFQDINITEQKKGRVGRLNDGIYFSLASKIMFQRIMNCDNTLIRLDRLFRTNDMPFILDNLGELMKEPNADTMIELIQDMSNTGFTVLPDGSTLRATEYGHILSKAFISLPLVMGDFIIRTYSFGCSLHGIIFAACCATDFRCIRKASHNGAGRDDDDLPVKLWMDRTSATLCNSDVELMVEMALNFLITGPLRHMLKDYEVNGKTVKSAYVVQPKDFSNEDGVYELMRVVQRIFFDLCKFRAKPIPILEFIAESLVRQYTLEYNDFGTGRYTTYRATPDTATLFRSCFIQSFGSRMVYIAPDEYQKDYGMRRMYRIGGKMPTGCARLVQGELPIKSMKDFAVYYEVVRRRSEAFLTGILHFVTASELVVYGNVVGSMRDEVDPKKCTLKIRTNTAPIYFKFPNIKTMMNVVRIRSILRRVAMDETTLDFSESDVFLKQFGDVNFATRRFIVKINQLLTSWIGDDQAYACLGNESNETDCYYRISEDGTEIIDAYGLPIRIGNSVSSSSNESAHISDSQITESHLSHDALIDAQSKRTSSHISSRRQSYLSQDSDRERQLQHSNVKFDHSTSFNQNTGESRRRQSFSVPRPTEDSRDRQNAGNYIVDGHGWNSSTNANTNVDHEHGPNSLYQRTFPAKNHSQPSKSDSSIDRPQYSNERSITNMSHGLNANPFKSNLDISRQPFSNERSKQEDRKRRMKMDDDAERERKWKEHFTPKDWNMRKNMSDVGKKNVMMSSNNEKENDPPSGGFSHNKEDNKFLNEKKKDEKDDEDDEYGPYSYMLRF